MMVVFEGKYFDLYVCWLIKRPGFTADVKMGVTMELKENQLRRKKQDLKLEKYLDDDVVS